MAAQCLSGEADEILNATKIRGGLVVHIGCGDGRLTAALCANNSYLVHGLDTEPTNVERARAHIRSRGLYGKVSVEQWKGARLPYTDGLVNLVVTEDLDSTSMEEVMRVLAPRGVAYVRKDGKWTKTVKPWPKEIDEWTHFLHDASNNAVARDELVGPPKHMQWVAGPMYCRSHEIDSSITAAVSARGRVFYIQDEGLTGITDERLPETWSVFARDAFNGVLLWKRPMPKWGWPEWKRSRLAGKDWSTLRGQRGAFPGELPRRLVAQGDRIYVTLGYRAPASVLDAATGELIRTCEGTESADEILLIRGTLVLRLRSALLDAQKRRTDRTAAESIVAIEAESGKELWRTDVGRAVALSLAADEEGVYFYDRKAIVCLSLKTGEQLWRTSTDVARKPQKKGGKKPKRRGGYTLVAQKGVVLLLGSQQLLALSAKTGDVMWTGPGGRGPGAGVPPDLFVAGGLAWYGRQTPGLLGPGPDGKRRGRGAVGASVVGYDLQTGEVKKKVELQNIISPNHHFRCHRSKATERYILWPKRGVEFIDLKADDHMRHDWLRAPCKYGVLPCNGLLYVPPHQCFCYVGVKLGGFNALAGQRSELRGQRPAEEADARLQRGPAYVSSLNTELGTLNTDGDWPTFRHDAKRSGATKSAVPARVALAWEAKLGGRLTQPTVADGKLFVASVNAHTVYALDARSGKQLWRYTAGGPVDSPPTIHAGLVLFGSADGWVYCLRALDGALAWRFRAAPEERRVMAFGQLESAWPVHGSVLVKDGIAYCSAGRSSYLDGGIRVFGLDPRTGKVLHRGRIEGPYPDLSKDIGRPFDMQGTFSDVLVTDGTYLYMQQVMLDSKLVEHEAPRVSAMGDRKVGRHIFSTAGFLDGSGFNRTFWMYSERWPGFYIANQSPKAGQLLVFDDTTTYGVKCFTRRNCHSPMFFPGKEGYLLFADSNDNEPQLVGRDGKPKPVNRLPYDNYKSSRGNTPVGQTAVDRDKGVGFTSPEPPKWKTWVPIRIRAMVRVDETLFVAGPPDVLDPEDPLAAFEDRKGARLVAVSPKDGGRLAELKLDSAPVFDGLVAAKGRLYMSVCDGRVVCYGAQ